MKLSEVRILEIQAIKVIRFARFCNVLTGLQDAMNRLMMNIKKIAFSASLIIVFLLLIPSPTRATTYIVFRYDDLSGDGPGVRNTLNERKQLWEAEQTVDKLFEKYKMSYVVAIIPKPTAAFYNLESSTFKHVSFGADFEKSELIKRAVQAGRIEVAQHGLSHVNQVDNPKHRLGEFRERPYERQLADILEGREILCESCGISNITTFVPPWHGWDFCTARALKEAGFSILSDRRFYYCKSLEGLTVIPCTAGLFELEWIVNQGHLPKDGIMVILYHPKDIIEFSGTEHCFGVEQFGRLLRKLSLLPDVQVLTFTQLAEKRDDLTIERFRKAVKVYTLRDFWTGLLPKCLSPGADLVPKLSLPGAEKHAFYLSAAEYSKSLWFWRTVTAAFALGVFILGLIIRRFLGSILSLTWRFRVDVIATLLFFSSILKEAQIIHKGYHMTAQSAVPAFLTGSFLIALILRGSRKLVLLKQAFGHFNLSK